MHSSALVFGRVRRRGPRLGRSGAGCRAGRAVSLLGGRPRRQPGPAPSGLGYRPVRVRISSAMARIVGAVAAKAAHQILAIAFLTSPSFSPPRRRAPLPGPDRAGGEVAIASNEPFSKAHVFTRTCVRWRRTCTGSRSGLVSGKRTAAANERFGRSRQIDLSAPRWSTAAGCAKHLT